jgi:DNA-binding transcriptional LysR family regulator
MMSVTSTLARIDMNLLVALDVLLEERHVTRAARRLGITQSAMSQTLRRLRSMLGDPLLVRRGTLMVTTPRADELAERLRATLRALERVLDERPMFEPARSRRRFRVAMLDIHGASVLPALLRRVLHVIGEEGPSIEVVPVNMDRLPDQLRHGDVDLGLVMTRELASDLAQEVVLHESLVALVRAGHPLTNGEFGVDDFLKYPHVSFSIAGHGASAVDEDIERRGLKRRTVLRLPYFLAAPSLVAGTDAIALVPRSVALALRGEDAVVSLPVPLGPSAYPIAMTWSRHVDADPANLWLREQVRAAARDLELPAPRSAVRVTRVKAAASGHRTS